MTSSLPKEFRRNNADIVSYLYCCLSRSGSVGMVLDRRKEGTSTGVTKMGARNKYVHVLVEYQDNPPACCCCFSVSIIVIMDCDSWCSFSIVSIFKLRLSINCWLN
jgi:hypothetical protein